MITIRKLASIIRIALSFGSVTEKRMIPSLLARHPAITTRPSTSSALAKIEPMIAVWAITISPAAEREHDDEELGQVSERGLEHAGGARRRSASPTCSVENETSQASPASASVERPNVRSEVACP